MLDHWIPSCHSRFSIRDFDFVVSCLGPRAHRSHLHELWSDPESQRELLDLQEVWQGLIDRPDSVTVTPRFYFYLLVRHAFLEADLTDTALAHYVAGVLSRRLESNPGDPLQNITHGFTRTAPFHALLHRASGRLRFHLQVAAGNQFLVLTGLYPEFINKRAQRENGPDILFYETFAQRSYRCATQCRSSVDRESRNTLGNLAESLPTVRRAMNRVAESYVFLGA